MRVPGFLALRAPGWSHAEGRVSHCALRGALLPENVAAPFLMHLLCRPVEFLFLNP
jgi:hypothetical protein